MFDGEDIESDQALTIRAVIDGVDAKFREMDRKWGIDRLRLNLTDEHRAGFDQQWRNWRNATSTNLYPPVKQHGDAMRGWLDAADRLAEGAGHVPEGEKVWQIALEHGERIAICQDDFDRERAVDVDDTWTLEELAVLIASLPEDARKARKLFAQTPGLGGVPKVRFTEDRFAAGGDELPF